MGYLKIILISFFISFLFLGSIVAKQQSRIDFYKNILKQNNNTQIEVVQDENKKLALRSNKNLNVEETFFNIPKKFIISECAFFPYKEKIIEILSSYHLIKSPLGATLFHFYSLVYQILYFRLSKVEEIRDSFRDNNFYSSEFYKFDFSKSQKEYLEIILNEYEEIKVDNVFHYDKETIELIKDLQIDNSIYEVTKEVYEHVKSKIEIMLGGKVRTHLLQFTSNWGSFKSVFDFVYRHHRIISSQ
jgi:hypothetical protein